MRKNRPCKYLRNVKRSKQEKHQASLKQNSPAKFLSKP